MKTHSSSAAGPRHKVVEAGIALLIALFGDHRDHREPESRDQLGAEGPRAVFCPFYIGIFIVVASAINFWHVLRDGGEGLFADGGFLRQVMSVVVPTAIYVSSMPFTGLYLTSIVFIGYFMRWLGKYSWLTVIAVAFGMPIITYFIFERYFLVPLPKGPIEDWLGILVGSSQSPLNTSVSFFRRTYTMEEIVNLFHGFSVALQPFNIMVMLLGIVLGVIIGVLPGLGGANGVAILLPLTFSMPPTSAIIMLSCIYWGALFGGAITSILFNIPGEPWSVATTFDGYPMADQGRAGEALTAAFTSSFIGALLGVLMITLVAPLVANFALRFGPAEKFAVCFLTFCSFVGLEQGPVKTVAAM